MSKELHLEYVDYGKVFLEHEASDFQILEYSSDDVLDIAGRQRCQNFMDAGLRFPEPASKTPFVGSVRNISVCFVRPSESYYLFIQIQRREEGELARHLHKTARLNRPFNQVRFVYIDKKSKEKEIVSIIQDGLGFYSGLLYKNPNPELVDVRISLKDYKAKMGNTYNGFTAQMSPVLFTDEVIKHIVNPLVSSFVRDGLLNWKFQIKDLALNTEEKLRILDAVQILLWPLCGLFSFSLDFISERPDINLHVYTVPNRKLPDLNNFVEDKNDFYNDLLKCRELYKDLFENEKFISKFRSYFNKIKNILDAAEISNIVLANPPRRKLIVFESPELFDAICKLGDLESFIGNATILSLARFLLKYRDSSNLSQLTREVILSRISAGASELPDEDLLRIIAAFWDVLAGLSSLSEGFLRALNYSQIPLIADNELKEEVFLKKTKMDDELESEWLKIYASFPKTFRIENQSILIRILEGDWSKLLTLDLNSKKIIYFDLFNYYHETGNLWRGRLFSNWLPGKDKQLDELFLDKMKTGDLDHLEVAEHLIEIKNSQGFTWLLNNIDFDATAFDVLYAKFIQITLNPHLSYEYMHNVLSAKLGDGIELEKEKNFFYNMFPVSRRVEEWVYEKLPSFDVSETSDFLDTLSHHPLLENGLEKNPRLRELLLDFKFDEKTFTDLPQNLLYAVLSRLDVQNSDRMVRYLVSRLPKTWANDVLNYVARQKLYKSIPIDVAIAWQKKITAKLRLVYLSGNVDSLREYLIALKNCSDDLLWEVCVEDVINRFPKKFVWREYIVSLPRSYVKNTAYGRFVSLVTSLETILNFEIDYHYRLEVCRDISLYYTGVKNQEMISRLHIHQNKISQDSQLTAEIKKILAPAQPASVYVDDIKKKAVFHTPSIEETRKTYSTSSLQEITPAANELASDKVKMKKNPEVGQSVVHITQQDKYSQEKISRRFDILDSAVLIAFFASVPVVIGLFDHLLDNSLNQIGFALFIVAFLFVCVAVLYFGVKFLLWLNDIFFK